MCAKEIQIGRKYSLPQVMSVLVTGAASGIGLAQTEAFLAHGHDVYGVDVKSENDRVKKLLDEYSENFTYICADVSDEASVQQLFERIENSQCTLHILCNTAGQLDDYQTIEQTSLSDFEYFLSVNLTSQFLMCKYALPLLLKNKSSRIINMASIAGLTAGGGGIAYTAAKHGIVGLTKQLAYDYGTQGLRANAIAPGAIATEMTQADFQDQDGKMAEWVAEETPIKRWASPDEIAGLTLFLASDASDYLQGVTIPVDGGWLIR